MAKITADQLQIAKGWQEFGDRLGWEFQGCSDRGATFIRDSIALEVISISPGHRADIERTWREQDKPAVKVVG